MVVDMHRLVCLWLGLLAASTDAAVRTTVVFRHTFRAPRTTLKCTPGIVPTIKEWNQFSERPWPDFGTAAQNATVRGLQLTTDFAALLPQKMPQIDSMTKIRLIFDENDRDRETAVALENGFKSVGLTDVTLEGNSSLFNVVAEGVCPSMTADARQADVESQQQNVVPKPADYDQLVAAMQSVLGHPTQNDSAPLLNSSVLDDYYSSGYWEGRTCLVASFAEVFLLEYGSKIQVGWGKVSRARVGVSVVKVVLVLSLIHI